MSGFSVTLRPVLAKSSRVEYVCSIKSQLLSGVLTL
ncbi:hypothetical protein EJMOOK_10955 [Rhodanobacter sp. Root179]